MCDSGLKTAVKQDYISVIQAQQFSLGISLNKSLKPVIFWLLNTCMFLSFRFLCLVNLIWCVCFHLRNAIPTITF